MFRNVPRAVRRAYDLLATLLVAVALAPVHDVETHRLDNGLTLHVAAGHPSPVAAIQAWVGVGSEDETAAQAGVAHVIEHMLFKGGEHGVGELSRAIAGSGGEINAWTSFDHIVFHAVLCKDLITDAIDAFVCALASPDRRSLF